MGVQLLATEPKLVDRAVLCGTAINRVPFVQLTRRLLALPARNSMYRWMVRRYRNAWQAKVPPAHIDEYREDVRLNTSGQLVDVIMASAGFTLPEELDKSDSPTLFVTGAKEMPVVRRWAAALAQQMPNGVDRVATGMPHDWPTRYSGPLRAHRRRLAHRWCPATRDRSAEVGSSLIEGTGLFSLIAVASVNLRQSAPRRRRCRRSPPKFGVFRTVFRHGVPTPLKDMSRQRCRNPR